MPEAPPRLARPFADFALPPDPDPAELIGRHYFERGSSLIVTGPTGVGKSSLESQFSTCWSLGRGFLGLDPVRPLRIVTFQAEQSDADIGYSRAGIFEGLKLTPEEIEKVRASYFIANHSGRTGQEFITGDLIPTLLQFPSDGFWLDPLFAFAGCDFKDQAAITRFLRGGIQPVLRRFQCGMMATHHANKPPSDKSTHRKGWNELDFAYAGSGTIELSNWTRAAIHIEPTRTPGVFQVLYGKRRNRLARTVERIRHNSNTDRPYWTELTAAEVEATTRPPIEVAKEKLLAAMPPGTRVLKDSVRHWNETLKVSRDNIRVALLELLESKQLVEEEEHRGRTIVKHIYRPNETRSAFSLLSQPPRD